MSAGDIVSIIITVLVIAAIGAVGLVAVAGYAGWRILNWSSARRVERAEQVEGMHTIDAEAPGTLRHREGDPVPALASAEGEFTVQGRVFRNPMSAVVAGPGSGKTQTVSIPLAYNILAARAAHLVIVDPKAEILDALCALGRVKEGFVYDFSSAATQTSAINVVGSPADARAFWEALIREPSAQDQYWSQAAIDLADAVSAALGYPDLIEVYETVRRPERLDALAEQDEEVRLSWASLPSKTRGSVLSTFQTKMGPLRNPAIRRIFEAGDAEQPRFGMFERDIVCVIPPAGAGEADVYAPLIGAVIDTLYRKATAGFRASGAYTYYVIEEAASVLQLRNLPNYINAGRGEGQRIMSVYQSLSQLEDRMGSKAAAQAIIGSCDVQLWGRTSDFPTAKAISELSGTVKVDKESYSESDNDGLRSSGSTSYSEDERPRLKPHHITGLPQFSFFNYDGDPETLAQVSVTPWYQYADRLMSPNPAQFGLLGIPSETPPSPPSQPSGGHSPSPDTGSPDSPTHGPESPATTKLKVCPNCSSETPATARYCGDCGCPLGPAGDAPGEAKYCTECGSKNPAEATACDTCGWALGNG